jgi:hypothetical protein
MLSLPPFYFIRTQSCLFLFWSSSLLHLNTILISSWDLCCILRYMLWKFWNAEASEDWVSSPKGYPSEGCQAYHESQRPSSGNKAPFRLPLSYGNWTQILPGVSSWLKWVAQPLCLLSTKQGWDMSSGNLELQEFCTLCLTWNQRCKMWGTYMCVCVFFFFFETGSCSAAQADLEL